MFKAIGNIIASSLERDFQIERKVRQYLPIQGMWEHCSETDILGNDVYQFIKISKGNVNVNYLQNPRVQMLYKYKDDDVIEDDFFKVYQTSITSLDNVDSVNANNITFLTTVKITKPQAGYYNTLEIDLSNATWNNGIIVLMLKHDSKKVKYIELPPINANNNYNDSIQFYADYYETGGIESHKQYDTYTTGGCGTSYVCLSDGKVYHKLDLINTRSKNIPINLNMCFSPETYISCNNDGSNFKTNYHCFINTDNANEIILEDNIGLKKCYQRITKEELEKMINIYKNDVSKLPLDVYYCFVDRTYMYKSGEEVILVTQDKHKIIFDVNKRFKSYTDIYNNEITCTWEEGKLIGINNSNGERITFTYDTPINVYIVYEVCTPNSGRKPSLPTYKIVYNINLKWSGNNFFFILRDENDCIIEECEILMQDNTIKQIFSKVTYDKTVFYYNDLGRISKIDVYRGGVLSED